MSNQPRSEVYRRGEIGNYHVYNRASQQLAQFGNNPITGCNNTDRRNWIHVLEMQLARCAR